MRVVLLALVIAAFVGCGDETSPAQPQGIFGPLGAPLPSATPEELSIFERGRAVALRRFGPADGLGPEFNVTSCAGCHEKPVLGGSASHYRDFLLIGDLLLPDTMVPRGKNGIQLQFSLETDRVPSDPLTNVSATRNPVPFFGAGLIAELPDEEILRRADPDDRDQDGVSGRANFDGFEVGRFGRKAQTSRIEIFIRGPLFNHMGVTSEPLPESLRAQLPSARHRGSASRSSAVTGVGTVTAAQAILLDEPTVDFDEAPDPEISAIELFELVAFSELLAAPQPEERTVASDRGAQVFAEIGCANCHTPSLQGPRGSLPLYSDLLVHDMGEALADGIPMGEATGREFRTQPLWGITATAPYLHDGRAGTLDEAIRWHGGEAAPAKDAYVDLRGATRADLLEFLESLGGRAQRTEGSLQAGAERPRPGEAGAPLPGLDPEALLEFDRGRLLFDRDFSFSEGVGPLFNGDACRSCHFDPVLGGAGPSGVDVMRQGVLAGEVFEAPGDGTGLPRHATDGTRPEPDPESNFFERRQTPTTLGLGLLERIPRETIAQRADPDDLDRDGVSGRLPVLDDGRLGRFGWKADVPSVREFVRDALSNELGMTVPAAPNASFGITADSDGTSDPEIDPASIDAMVAFLQSLAPPPSNVRDPEREAAGRALFESAGCGACHVPVLRTEDGTEIRAYTDLLLHDVAVPGAGGIEHGAAEAREFRTPPLWGLNATAPYMHDGRATTIDEAIDLHASEATSSRAAVQAFNREERRALVAFLESL